MKIILDIACICLFFSGCFSLLIALFVYNTSTHPKDKDLAQSEAEHYKEMVSRTDNPEMKSILQFCALDAEEYADGDEKFPLWHIVVLVVFGIACIICSIIFWA